MTRRNILLPSGAFLLFLAFLLWFFQDDFLTDGWLGSHALRHRVDGEIKRFNDVSPLLRRERKDGPLLLKIPLNGGLVVRYDFDAKKSEKVDVGSWDLATGEVVQCEGSFIVSEEHEAGKYSTYGKYALKGASSPSGSKLALVSAYGPKFPSGGFIFGGGRNIRGQRYLEIKASQPPYANLRKPIRAADETWRSLCWTHDEEALVYFDQEYLYTYSVVSLH